MIEFFITVVLSLVIESIMIIFCSTGLEKLKNEKIERLTTDAAREIYIKKYIIREAIKGYVNDTEIEAKIEELSKLDGDELSKTLLNVQSSYQNQIIIKRREIDETLKINK